METKRHLLAVFFISIIILLTPKWMSLFSPVVPTIDGNVSKQKINHINMVDSVIKNTLFQKASSGLERHVEKLIHVETDLFIATLSNQAGGSLVSFKLKNYVGSFNDAGIYDDSLGVVLVNQNNSSGCMPCIRYKDGFSGNLQYFNQFFNYSDKDSIFISSDDVYELNFSYNTINNGIIIKKLLIRGDSYTMNHSFEFKNLDFNYSDIIELSWVGGVLPTEKVESEDIQNASFIATLGENYEKFYYTSSDSIKYDSFAGNASWVGIKNKYFLLSLIPDRPGSSAAHSYNSFSFGNRKITPQYNAFLSFPSSDDFSLSFRLYFGPLDYNTLKFESVGLENAISFGWTIIHPFSKGILFILMFLKKYINNYGLVLILFAFIIRIITGPLTKKAAVSSQKMQSIQPQLKKIQKKYAGNPQKLNAETISLYKNSGVNPLGGCLPILIQMPLLFSLFLVFRTTIEFRGAEFFFWINDLSQPDAVFELPFSIPLYGSYVCILPIFMSITMFIQQSYSMAAATDKNQKIMMQFMSVVFFLIFNSFPSGLNLYYTIANILNILQQRSIKHSNKN